MKFSPGEDDLSEFVPTAAFDYVNITSEIPNFTEFRSGKIFWTCSLRFSDGECTSMKVLFLKNDLYSTDKLPETFCSL